MRPFIVVFVVAVLLSLPVACLGEINTQARTAMMYQLTEGSREFEFMPSVEGRSFYLSSNGVPLYSGFVGQGRILFFYNGFYLDQVSSQAIRGLTSNFNKKEDVLKDREVGCSFGKIFDTRVARWDISLSYVDQRPLSKPSGMDVLITSIEASWYDSDIYFTNEGVAGHLYLGANRRFAADHDSKLDSWQAKAGAQGESWTSWLAVSGAGELMYDSGSFGAKPAYIAKLDLGLGPRMWNMWLKESFEATIVFAKGNNVSANEIPRYTGMFKREKVRLWLGVSLVPFFPED